MNAESKFAVLQIIMLVVEVSLASTLDFEWWTIMIITIHLLLLAIYYKKGELIK